MGTKDYLLQETAFQKRVSTSGPPLVSIYSEAGMIKIRNPHKRI
jgi:hypothetical protein